MAETFTVYLHFPCFDGIVSAVLASEYLKRKQGIETGQFVPVNYSDRQTWLTRPLQKPAAVVDFLYHPDAAFWADHHQTTFLTPQLEQQFRQSGSADLLFDPDATSCAEVIWRKSYRLLREPRFREMVDWARRIDGARYETVNDAVLGDAPALQINLSLMQDASAEYCRVLIEGLRSGSLADVAASAQVQRNYKKARAAILSGQKLFRKGAHIEKDDIVVFHVGDTGKAHLSRYAPYLEYPGARYSVGILQTGEGAKITAMRNPWRRFKSVPLGKIFSSYGGGGHQRVASVLLKDEDEAKRTLKSILTDMREASRHPIHLQEGLTGD
jgi:hypothetical protein